MFTGKRSANSLHIAKTEDWPWVLQETLTDRPGACKERSMAPMTEHERETFTQLCARINEEKNAEVFSELVTELEAFLEKLSVHRPAQP